MAILQRRVADSMTSKRKKAPETRAAASDPASSDAAHADQYEMSRQAAELLRKYFFELSAIVVSNSRTALEDPEHRNKPLEFLSAIHSRAATSNPFAVRELCLCHGDDMFAGPSCNPKKSQHSMRICAAPIDFEGKNTKDPNLAKILEYRDAARSAMKDYLKPNQAGAAPALPVLL